jgi:hypothetical protein
MPQKGECFFQRASMVCGGRGLVLDPLLVFVAGKEAKLFCFFLFPVFSFSSIFMFTPK